MGWTSPHSYATSDVVTAANLNETRDNLNDLDRRATLGYDLVGTSQTTASTSYTALATAGPAVTVTVGSSGLALVILTCTMSNDTTGSTCLMSFDVSGATTVAASDNFALSFTSYTANATQRFSIVYPVTITAGSNTFTAKYRVSANTGTFVGRYISVIPLGS